MSKIAQNAFMFKFLWE